MNEIVERARALGPQIAQLGLQAERDGFLPDTLVALLREARLFDIFMPRALGGLELEFQDALDVIETVAAADPATGWCLLKASTTNEMAAYLDVPVAQRLWDEPGVTGAGNMNPARGKAIKADGGYRLTGRWDWGTSTRFSKVLIAGALVFGPEGGPPQGARILFVPAERAAFFDTWEVYGMRGTNSRDYAFEDVFVPEEQAIDPANMVSRHDGPLYRATPFMAHAMAPHGALAIGIARGALKALIALASEKTPLLSKTLLKDKAHVQDAVGRAAAEIEAADAYLRAAVKRAFSGAPFTPEIGLHLSLAATHATHRAVAVVDWMAQAAGGTAVYTASPIQRYFRDMHVAASHVLVNVERYQGAGKVVFGDAMSTMG